MPHGAISCHSPPPSSSRTSLDVDEVVFCKSEINYGHVHGENAFCGAVVGGAT